MREPHLSFSFATGFLKSGFPVLCRFLICALLLFWGRGLFARTIVQDGKSDWAIAVPQSSSPPVAFAAGELKRYLAEITGVQLPTHDSELVRENLLVVGTYEQVEPLGLPANFVRSKHSEGFTIVASANKIWISGRTDAATLRGVYVFLDDLGCRFLSPQFGFYQGAGEVIPKLSTVKLHKEGGKSEPVLAFRKLYVESGHSHDLQSLRQMIEWMPKVGYNTLVVPLDFNNSGRVKWDNWREALTPELRKRGLILEVGGHGYQNFIHAQMEGGKLFLQYPEWFGQDEKGKRQRAKTRVFCTSNSDAVAYVTSNFLAYVKARPEIQIFDFWPPDGAKWCECEPCRKVGEPPDRQAILLQHVQGKMRAARPDLRLEVIAYASYINPPRKVPIDKKVLVDFCPISQHFDEPIYAPGSKNKYYVDALRKWRESFDGDISIYSYYRKYAWDSLPVVIPHYMQSDLQWYATVPVQGVSTYSEPADWFTYELNHYVLAQLAWDPHVNVDSLIEKFCAGRYGKEARIAREALSMLERVTRRYGSVPHVPLKPAEEIRAAENEVDRVLQTLSAAEARTQEPTTLRSLHKLNLMCLYAKKDLEIQGLRATNAMVEVIRKKASALHGWVAEHSEEGVFLIKGNRLNLNRMLTRYGVGNKKAPTDE